MATGHTAANCNKNPTSNTHRARTAVPVRHSLNYTGSATEALSSLPEVSRRPLRLNATREGTTLGVCIFVHLVPRAYLPRASIFLFPSVDVFPNRFLLWRPVSVKGTRTVRSVPSSAVTDAARVARVSDAPYTCVRQREHYVLQPKNIAAVPFMAKIRERYIIGALSPARQKSQKL